MRVPSAIPAGIALTLAFTLPFTLAGTPSAPTAASAAVERDLFELVKVKDGVWAALARPTSPLNCNAGVIVTDRDVIVVDTHGTPSAAEALLRQIGKITRLPVRYVVNTHFHYDHARGNQAYLRPYPREVAIISTDATRDALERLEAPQLAKELADMPARLARLREDAAAARTPEARQRLADAERFHAELKRMRVVLPDLTFDRSLHIHRKDGPVLVLFLGRAHTAGDAVVYLPRQKVVVTGDLLTSWGPGMGDGYPNEWLKTLDELAKLDVDAVIGGHGKVGGKEMIGVLRAYIADVIAEVKREVAQGTPQPALEKAVLERLVARHADKFAPGELASRVPGAIKKVYEDVKAGRY